MFQQQLAAAVLLLVDEDVRRHRHVTANNVYHPNLFIAQEQMGQNNSRLPLLNPYGNPNPITIVVSKSFSPAQSLQYSLIF